MTVHYKRKKTMASAITAPNGAPNSFHPQGTGDEETTSAATRSAASLVTISANVDDQHRSGPSHDTSIDELASGLLGESDMSQFQAHPGRRLSSQSVVNVPHHLSDRTQNELPQLPHLPFNNDDAWTLQFRPAAGFADNEQENHLPGHAQKPLNNTVPVLPPKSLQRTLTSRQRRRQDVLIKSEKAARSRILRETALNRNLANASSHSPNPRPEQNQEEITMSSQLSMARSQPDNQRKLTDDTITSLQSKALGQDSPVPDNKPLDVDGKIEAMLKATDDLKGKKESTPFQKKGRHIFSRVKHAFTTHRAKNNDPARDDHLLDPKLNEMPDFEELPLTTISAVESCINEGLNLNKSKVRALTGNGNIARKPLPDDGKSLRSYKSLEDSSENATNMRHELSDCLEKYPALIPQRASSTTRSLPPLPPFIASQSPPFIPRISSRSNSHTSSSPDGMSTPRLKLKSSETSDGTRGRLMVVAASTPSLLDRGTVRQTASHMIPNHLRDSDARFPVTTGLAAPKDQYCRKKHPSPSKGELEQLGQSLSTYTSMMAASPPRPFPSARPLALQDTNSSGFTHHPRGAASAHTSHTMEHETPVQIPKRAAMIPKSATGVELPIRRRPPPPAPHLDSSLLEDSSMDELQWDADEYHVGMRRG